MKKTIFMTVCLAVLAHAGSATAQQQDLSKVEIETIPLRGGVYMLIGAGGNIGVSTGPDGVLIIDDQFAPMVDKIEAAVGEVTDKPVTYVLNTHWHGDHTGGNESFGKAGAVIVAHDNVRERMSVDQVGGFSGNTIPASPADALPVITFSENTTLYFNEETIRAYHVPSAHTDGDAIIHFENANVLHMGDTFFNGMFPFIDSGSGGGADGFIDALSFALTISDADTQIIPGHGPLADRKVLEETHRKMVEARDKIRALIAEGKQLGEILEAKPLAYLDADWAQGFLNSDNLVRYLHAAEMKPR